VAICTDFPEELEHLTHFDLAKILAKLEAGKKLSTLEQLKILPVLIVRDIENMLEEYRRDGKIKPRRRLF